MFIKQHIKSCGVKYILLSVFLEPFFLNPHDLMCCVKTQCVQPDFKVSILVTTESHDYRDVIVFKKLLFLNVFRPH